MQKIKVVILSAKGQESDRLQGQQAGADGYLTKPFSPKQLLSVVTQFTD
ncbi:MAG TPA: response regulator [Aquabacterium sp.]|nr:response regulator [Aquabacterium sp.]